MKTMFKIYAKKMFGVRYERLAKAIFIDLIVFWGLHSSGFRIQIRPFILYLMVSTFTAGVMRQTLSAEAQADDMMNLLMLPIKRKAFIFGYVSVLGGYTVLIRAGVLVAAVSAIAPWNSLEIICGILCACNAVLMTAAVYSWRKRQGSGVIWAGAFTASIFLLQDAGIFLAVVVGNVLAAAVLLCGADAYSFYRKEGRRKQLMRVSRRHSVWRYLFRYLTAHKNYLANTAVMWGAACVLPVMFGQMESRSALPVGFAVLSINTPVCILLSCDPALEQAVRLLPGQKKAFCIPYCLFVFLCNTIADAIYLVSWELQTGDVTAAAVWMGAFFSFQSAVMSVLLEWFFPLRGWKTQSDLWHHPRKYAVPVLMMLEAGMAGRFLG